MTFTCRRCGGEVSPGQGYLETQMHIDAAVCVGILRDWVDKLKAELAELKHPADEPETTDPPDEIWLQWYGDGDGNYLWPDDVDRAGVTFSTYQVWSRDIRYVRARRGRRPRPAAESATGAPNDLRPLDISGGERLE